MKQIIYDNYSELSVKTAEMIAAIISDKPDALLCFPASIVKSHLNSFLLLDKDASKYL